MGVKISQLEAGMSAVNIEANVIEVSEPRTVNTRFGPRKVAKATIEDETGTIALSLWEEQIEKVKVGQRIKISGSFVSEWNEQLQLNIGRTGKLEVE